MMTGLSNSDGKSIDGIDHLRQSVRDILSTRIGERVMRREYGSNIMALVDNPMNDAWRLDVTTEAWRALDKWEPRIKVKKVLIREVTTGGHATFEIEAILVENGQPIRLEGIVV